MKFDYKKHLLFFYLCIGIIVLIVISTIILRYCFHDWNDKISAFGDSFGGINALFSGFAFAGIIYTILLQHEELRLQRKELISTREEMKKSADAQIESEKSIRNQVETMKLTAKLNAYSTLINYHSLIYDKNIRINSDLARKSELIKEENIKNIEKILNEL